MTGARATAAAGGLVLEAGTGLLAVLLHHGLTAEYGDVTDSVLQATVAGPATEVSVVALVLVGVLGLPVLVVAPRRWMRVAAVLLALGLPVALLAVTPLALEAKLAQYDATPRCLSDAERAAGPSPYRGEARASQRAVDSVEQVVLFHGGGASGVGGCDRGFVVLDEQVDVLAHYRTVLPGAGWRIVEDVDGRLRAERGEMALEVVTCEEGGVLWAGRRATRTEAACRDDDAVVAP